MGKEQTVTPLLYRPGVSCDDCPHSAAREPAAPTGVHLRRARRRQRCLGRFSRLVPQHCQYQDGAGGHVVVPLNAEHVPPLPFWQAVTQIL